MAFYKVDHMVKYNGEWYNAGDKIKVEDSDAAAIEEVGGYLVDGRTGRPMKTEGKPVKRGK